MLLNLVQCRSFPSHYCPRSWESRFWQSSQPMLLNFGLCRSFPLPPSRYVTLRPVKFGYGESRCGHAKMTKLKSAIVFVTAFTLFVLVWLQLMSLYAATYGATLSLLKPVRFWVI